MEPFKMKQDEHFIIERKSIELLIAAPETCRFWWHDSCSLENRKFIRHAHGNNNFVGGCLGARLHREPPALMRGRP